MCAEKLNKARRALRFAEYGVTILFVALLGFGIFGYLTGAPPFYVISDYPSSMSPTINYGGLVVIYNTPFSSLAKGDIIAFKDPTGVPITVIHRVVQVIPNCSARSPCILTKGDNNYTNPTIDPWNVTEQNYVGREILVVPYIGYLSPSLWKGDGLLEFSPIAFIVIATGFIYLLMQNPVKRNSKRAIQEKS